MKLAILATGTMVPYLEEQIEMLEADTNAELRLFDFQRLSNLKELYLELKDQFDGFILSGTAVQATLKQYFHDDLKPAAVFDTNMEEVYYAIIKLLNQNRAIDLNKVVIDIYLLISRTHNCQVFLDMADKDSAKAQNKSFWDNADPETLAAVEDTIFDRIMEKWNRGELEHVISRNSVVAPRLQDAGIPCTFLYPTKNHLDNAIRYCINLITMERMTDYTASVIAVIKENQTEITEMDLDGIRLQKALLDYNAENMTDFQIQKTANGFFIFTNLKTVNRITKHLKCCTLSTYLNERLDFRTHVAYGISRDLAVARTNALTAMKESVQQKSVYAVMYDSLIGPLTPGAEPMQLSPLTPELEQAAKIAFLSPLTVQKIKTILTLQNSQDITAAELAEKLNVKIRNANRILGNLTEAGIALQSGMKSTGTKGRPTKIYHISL